MERLDFARRETERFRRESRAQMSFTRWLGDRGEQGVKLLRLIGCEDGFIREQHARNAQLIQRGLNEARLPIRHHQHREVRWNERFPSSQNLPGKHSRCFRGHHARKQILRCLDREEFIRLPCPEMQRRQRTVLVLKRILIRAPGGFHACETDLIDYKGPRIL